MDATITGLTAEQAYYIVDSINPDAARVSGAGEDEVTISPEGLAELAAMPDDSDGYFDGRFVWIGDTEHTVRGL